MKKRISSIVSLALVLLMLTALMPQRAEAAGISFSGAGSLREGERVTVTFSLSGSSVYAVEAYLDYDSSHLTLEDISQEIGGGWVMDRNGSKIVLRDTTLNDPINSGRSLFSATFRVDSGTSAGTSVWASVSGVTVSDGESDISLGSTSWSADILAPLSGNNYLSYLTCSNGTLEPAFSPDVREYSMTVPYEVDALALDWGRDSGSSWASLSGNSLSVGSNTVSITVTAENGNTRTYYIYVTRQEDPNYVPKTDATLSALTASVGTLSPAFDPATLDYVIYVPYEVESISLTGTAADAKAKGVAQGSSDQLQPGDNLLQVVCTAEDGTTTMTYQVHVVRMPAYAGAVPTITGIEPKAVSAPTKEEPKAPDTLQIPRTMTLPLIGTVPTWAVGAAVLALVLVVLFLLAWFWGRHSGKKKMLRQLGDSTAMGEGAYHFSLQEGAEDVMITEAPAVETVSGAAVQPPVAAAAETAEEIPKPTAAEELAAEEASIGSVPTEEGTADGEAIDSESAMAARIAAEVSTQSPAEPVKEEKQGTMSLQEILDDIRNM